MDLLTHAGLPSLENANIKGLTLVQFSAQLNHFAQYVGWLE